MQIPKIAVIFCTFALTATIVQAADNADQAAARAALVAKLFELSAQEAQTNTFKVAPKTVAPVAAKATVAVEKPKAAAKVVAPTVKTETKTVVKKDKPVVKKEAPKKEVVKKEIPAAKPVIKTSSDFAPIAAPALPLSAIKQQKLQDLLAKYKADQITPEEYHRQRAVILEGM